MRIFNISGRAMRSVSKPAYKRNARALCPETKSSVADFLQPDNAVTLPNKKYVLKRLKKARQVLNKPMRKHYHDLCLESKKKVGFSTFYKLRPRHIAPRRCNKWAQNLRDKCENVDLKISAVNSKIQFCTKYDLVAETMCPKEGKYFKRNCAEKMP